MILGARKCGCAEYNEPKASQSSILWSSESSLQLSDSESSFSSESCCEKDDESDCETDDGPEEPTVESEIVCNSISKGLPYKEIEAIFNNNRMVMRIQKEKPSNFDPPCDCKEDPPTEPQSDCKLPHKQPDHVFQKSNGGCRTISLFPKPGLITESQKKDTRKMDGTRKGKPSPLPTVNPEENPNIFVFKIKAGDKRHSLDLEFKTPRPWRKRDW